MIYRKFSDKEYNLDYEIRNSISEMYRYVVKQDMPPLITEVDNYKNVLFLCEHLQFFELWFNLKYYPLFEYIKQHKNPEFVYREFYLVEHEKEKLRTFSSLIPNFIYYVKNDRFRFTLTSTFRNDPNLFNHFFSYVNPLVVKAVDLLKQVDFWMLDDFQVSNQLDEDGFMPICSEQYAFVGCLFQMDKELNIYRPDNQQSNSLKSNIETVDSPHVYKNEIARNLFEHIISNWNYNFDLRFSYIYNFLSENDYETPYKNDYETYIRKRFEFTKKFQYENAYSPKKLNELKELEKDFNQK